MCAGMVAQLDGAKFMRFRCPTSTTMHDLSANWCTAWEKVPGPHIVQRGRFSRGQVHIQEHIEGGARATLELMLDKLTSLPLPICDEGSAACPSTPPRPVQRDAVEMDSHQIGLMKISEYISSHGGEATIGDVIRHMNGGGWRNVTATFLADTFESPKPGYIVDVLAPRPPLLLSDVISASSANAGLSQMLSTMLSEGTGAHDVLARMTRAMDELGLLPDRGGIRLERSRMPSPSIPSTTKRRRLSAIERQSTNELKSAKLLAKMFSPQDKGKAKMDGSAGDSTTPADHDNTIVTGSPGMSSKRGHLQQLAHICCLGVL